MPKQFNPCSSLRGVRGSGRRSNLEIIAEWIAAATCGRPRNDEIMAHCLKSENRTTFTGNKMEFKTAKKNYAMYHVGLKILLQKGEEFLFLRSADGVSWDLPGGRIDDVEHETPLVEILAREVAEELGGEIKYKLGKPLFQFRRYFENKGWHIFCVVYEAEYVSGEIQLSSEHSGYQWISPKDFQFSEKDFFSAEEFRAFQEYFREFSMR